HLWLVFARRSGLAAASLRHLLSWIGRERSRCPVSRATSWQRCREVWRDCRGARNSMGTEFIRPLCSRDLVVVMSHGETLCKRTTTNERVLRRLDPEQVAATTQSLVFHVGPAHGDLWTANYLDVSDEAAQPEGFVSNLLVLDQEDRSVLLYS